MVIAGNHDLSLDAKASAVGTPYRHIIEHPELEKVGKLSQTPLALKLLSERFAIPAQTAGGIEMRGSCNLYQ